MTDSSGETRNLSDDYVESEPPSYVNKTSSDLRFRNSFSSEIVVDSPLIEDERVLVEFPRNTSKRGRGNCHVALGDMSLGFRFQNAESGRPCGSSEAESCGVLKMGRKGLADIKKQILAYRATRSQWTIDKEMTETSIDSLNELRWKYQIPDFVELRLIGDDEFPSHPPPGYVTLYPAMFAIGIRVPFQPHVHDWISEFGVAPAQINPNGYRVIISLFVLWREKFNCDPPLDILRHSLMLMRNSSSVNTPIKGFFCISSRRRCSLIGLPSCGSSWRHKWFFAKGWEATPKDGTLLPDIVTCFRDAGCFGRPRLLFIISNMFIY